MHHLHHEEGAVGPLTDTAASKHRREASTIASRASSSSWRQESAAFTVGHWAHQNDSARVAASGLSLEMTMVYTHGNDHGISSRACASPYTTTFSCDCPMLAALKCFSSPPSVARFAPHVLPGKLRQSVGCLHGVHSVRCGQLSCDTRLPLSLLHASLPARP